MVSAPFGVALALIGAVSLVVLALGCREEQPPPDAGPVQDPVAPDLIDLACALVTSCAELGSETITTCATSALTRPGSGPRYTEDYTGCLEAAGANCDDVTQCQPTIAGDPCATVGEGSFCDGDLIVSCFAGSLEYMSDCAAWGLKCFEENDRAMCQGDGPSCLQGNERCEGVDAIICMGFREATFRCSDFVEDRICEMRGERAECVVQEPQCDPIATTATCENAELLFCSASGVLVRLDCVALGFEACVIDETDRAICGTPIAEE